MEGERSEPKEDWIMALRDEMNNLMMTEVQRFRDEPLTKEEQAQIVNDVMAFCIIEIRKYCGANIFEVKSKELQEKGINKLRPVATMTIGDMKKKNG